MNRVKCELTEVAIYCGDEFIMIGTYKECAEKLKITERTVRFLATPTSRKRSEGTDRMIAVRFEDDDE